MIQLNSCKSDRVVFQLPTDCSLLLYSKCLIFLLSGRTCHTLVPQHFADPVQDESKQLVVYSIYAVGHPACMNKNRSPCTALAWLGGLPLGIVFQLDALKHDTTMHSRSFYPPPPPPLSLKQSSFSCMYLHSQTTLTLTQLNRYICPASKLLNS